MSVWYDGSIELNCDLQTVNAAQADLGVFYEGVISCMPGLSDVALVDQGPDFVTLRTSEGMLKRTSIDRQVTEDGVVIDSKEEYSAAKLVTATAHFREEFTVGPTGVSIRLTISALEAPGFLGFIYKHLASSNIGKALLESHKAHLEAQA